MIYDNALGNDNATTEIGGGSIKIHSYHLLTIMARYAISFTRGLLGYGRRCSIRGAEGARDRVLARGLETLRQKDCRKRNPWRDLCVRSPKE